jgi:ubiquinone biosynthesis protein
VELVDGVVRRDQNRAAAVLLKITTWDQEPDLRQLEREVSEFMGRHLYRPLKEIQIARLFHDLLLLASRNHLRIPPDIFLMLKALSTVEGVGLMLDPDFDMIKRAEPYIKRVLAARFTPPRVLGEILKTSSELLKFVQQFPRDLLEITRLVRQQRLAVNIEHQGLKPLLETHDQVSNRISFAIIIAALIIGSALIVRSGTPPFIFGFSMIGIIGFLAAAVMGVWLLVAILRRGRL